MKRLGFVLLFSLLVFSCRLMFEDDTDSVVTGSNGTGDTNGTKNVYITEVNEVSGTQIDGIISSNKVVFVDIYKNGCGNCEGLDEILNDLIKDKKLVNGKIIKSLKFSNLTSTDTDKFGLSRDGMITTPVCLLYVDGQCNDAYSGYKSKDDFIKFLGKYLYCEDCEQSKGLEQCTGCGQSNGCEQGNCCEQVSGCEQGNGCCVQKI